jgi:hypothetical protein
MNDQYKNAISDIESALMGVKWNNEDHTGTLFFFPTSSPGAKGVMRAGDHKLVFKTPLEYEVFFKDSNPYLHIIDNKKGEVVEYKIERLSKPLRTLTIIDRDGNKSNFKYI